MTTLVGSALRGGAAWRVPAVLAILSIVPIVAGSLHLLELGLLVGSALALSISSGWVIRRPAARRPAARRPPTAGSR